MDIKTEAEARVFALRYGAISLEEIITWADSHIQSDENPNYNFLVLSLAKSTGEAISALNGLGTSNDKANVAKLTFRFFYNSLIADHANFKKISKALFDMVLIGYVPNSEPGGEMWSFGMI